MINKVYIVLILTALVFCACKKKQLQANHKEHDMDMENMTHSSSGIQTIYTCPMHPQIIRDKPGPCPICGMDLVEKKVDSPAHNNPSLNLSLKPANQYALSLVKSTYPVSQELPIIISASGIIGYDTKEVNTISARVSGRIEKLYIKYQYQQINVGQPIMDIYSKELLTEQENYLYILNSDSSNKSLLKTAETRLLLQGLNSSQINQLRKTRKPFQYVTVHSLYSGHLHQLNEVQGSTTQSMSSSINMPTQEITLKEGMYVDKGQVVFNIYSTKKVWALLYIYPDDIAMVKLGQPVTLNIDGIEDEIKANIDFIEPAIQNNIQTPVLRVYLSNNTGQIKIGAIVKAKIFAGTKTGLFIPSTAIVHLGTSDVVFTQENNSFKAQFVQKGIRIGNNVEIISGIEKNSKIAINAQYLIDSESFIKVYNE